MAIKIKGAPHSMERRLHKSNKVNSSELAPNDGQGNLWVYGDSFANQPSPYLSMIAKELNLNQQNYAWPGSSLDYSSVQINKTMNSWTEKDVVILVLTEVLRVWERWEHKDHGTKHFKGRHIPESAILDMKDSKGSRGLEDMPLQPTIQINTSLRNHLIRVLSYANVRAMVVLDGFKNKANSSIDIPDNITYSDKGYLMEVSIKEPKGWFNFTTNGPDWRNNHLSEVNHPILAEKVCNAVKNGTNIDLSTGFEADIFRVDEPEK
jgi:hypothetical protein